MMFEHSRIHAIVGADMELLRRVRDIACLEGRDANIGYLNCPEDGRHPVRIGPMIRGLRESLERKATSKILLITYSPLVLNELQGHEVSLVTADKDGNPVVTRFDRTKNFERRIGAFALGELWLTFCDGGAEAELVP